MQAQHEKAPLNALGKGHLIAKSVIGFSVGEKVVLASGKQLSKVGAKARGQHLGELGEGNGVELSLG